MAAKTHIRLHYQSGKVVTETMLRLAHENGISLRDARRMVDIWVTWGDLVLRSDGGYDVKRQRPRRDARTMAALHG